jgi:hypothetical protein
MSIHFTRLVVDTSVNRGPFVQDRSIVQTFAIQAFGKFQLSLSSPQITSASDA